MTFGVFRVLRFFRVSKVVDGRLVARGRATDGNSTSIKAHLHGRLVAQTGRKVATTINTGGSMAARSRRGK